MKSIFVLTILKNISVMAEVWRAVKIITRNWKSSERAVCVNGNQNKEILIQTQVLSVKKKISKNASQINIPACIWKKNSSKTNKQKQKKNCSVVFLCNDLMYIGAMKSALD